MTRETQGARRRPTKSSAPRGAQGRAGAASGDTPAGSAGGADPSARQARPSAKGPSAKASSAKASSAKAPSAKGPRVAVQLTGKQKTFLRGLAHELKPVVQIGVAGLTDGVALQIDGALEIHELIKVKVAKEAPIDADAVGGPLEAIGAALAQRIGRTVVLYRPRRQDPAIRLPR